MRARAAEQRGIGDVEAMRKRREDAARQVAAGTDSCFGAARARALREQLRRRNQPPTAPVCVESTSHKPDYDVYGDEPVRKRARMETLVSKIDHVNATRTSHRTKARKTRKAKPAATPARRHGRAMPLGRPARALALHLKARARRPPLRSFAYTPHLEAIPVSARLQEFVRRKLSPDADHPCYVRALEAGGGGDCLFHSFAAALELMVRSNTPAAQHVLARLP